MFECVRESILETEREMERRRRKKERVYVHAHVPWNKCGGKETVYDSLPPSFKLWLSNSVQQALQQCFPPLRYLVDSKTSGFTILKLILSDVEKFMDFTLYRDLLHIKSINFLNVLYIAAQLMLFLSEDKLYTIPPLFWKCFEINVNYLLLVNNISL